MLGGPVADEFQPRWIEAMQGREWPFRVPPFGRLGGKTGDIGGIDAGPLGTIGCKG
ncbi:hypothetical protein D3C87_1973230 [compost metagenome]